MILAIILLIIFGIYLFLFPPLPLIPKIGRSLPSNYSEGDQEFSKRVQKSFPVGIPKKDLEKLLLKDGFGIYLDGGNFHVSNEDILKSKLGVDVKDLFNNLLENGYVDKYGVFQKSFLELNGYSNLKLKPIYDVKKEQIYDILSPRARRMRAQFNKSQFPCDAYWMILWGVDAEDKVSDLTAHYGATCL